VHTGAAEHGAVLNTEASLTVSGLQDPMLEIHKYRILERSRLRAKGVSEDEIEKMQHLPFRPAFVDGKRREREANNDSQLSAEQFAFRRKS